MINTHFLFTFKADDNKENGSELASQINRSTQPSSQLGTTKDQALVKKIATTSNRSYQEASTVINTRSTTTSHQTTGSSLLMGKIVGSNKDVTEETLFVGSEIPKYGVLTNHEMELEKVYESLNCFDIILISIISMRSLLTNMNLICFIVGNWKRQLLGS